ncbi:cobalt-precorrin-5B (C(1))-methyltransferase CbiD [Methanothermococcus okinawensis]|uniref:Cobalt-precorrin-5B C(1)-methyltransferase n=1 Tax=Methanothermococcus okinawensis (strain DSM 14208 / JCM 11175 / IH1) TaxID=647113 RepID=F8AMG9_METOI|nr:cobalt-precorrin-5B (C(1))-methyltransferase CbiD [Methanothermococcus okinawensis]AEH06009.1 cobalt-precorrin-6A synthase (deacetylating) [Methanothermococcus okinawensis IH1]
MIYDFRKEKKFGYTTGSCAAAGAYCGVYYLKKGIKLDYVQLENDKGDKLIIPIENLDVDAKSKKAVVTVKKFAGEDIDITNGIDIITEVKLINNDKINDNKINDNNYNNIKIHDSKPKVEIIGGKGIGIVTKEGLQIKKGNYAINPKPQELIRNNIIPLLDEHDRVVIKISIPKGTELAKKTLNPKLGIVGGISILGTTGIVRPMSNDAYKKSLVPQIDVALANNYKNLIFTPGNIGTKYAKKMFDVSDDQIVEVSNFWDFMLDKALEKGVNDILIFGHSGKIIKLAAGIYNTHSKVADGRNEVLTAYSSLYIKDREILKNILYANTTEEIIKILKKEGVLTEVFNSIANRVVERARNRWAGINFSCIIIDMKGNILGRYP